jgi:hypothetical protein
VGNIVAGHFQGSATLLFVVVTRFRLHMASAPAAVMTLADLVEAENCVDWSQAITLTCPKCQREVAVEDGLDMCCAMFEPELISALQNSTASGGCKWYHRNSYQSQESVYYFKSSHHKIRQCKQSMAPHPY